MTAMDGSNLPEYFSLLWPEGADPDPDPERPRWGERTQADLGIETLARHISPDPRHTPSILSFLLPLTTEGDIIRYRQEVLEDFLRVPELAKVFEALQTPLSEMERLGGPTPAEQTPLHKTLYRMSELEMYVDCIEKLGVVLSSNRPKIQSAALLRLLDFVSKIRNDPGFLTMARELPKLRARCDNVAGISIGVNLDDGLHPIGATLLSIRHKPFRQGTFLSRLFGKGSPEDEQGIAPLHELPLKRVYGTYASVETFAREDPELFPLFKDLDVILKEITRPIAQILTQYLQVNTAPLAGLGDEVVFYLNAVRLMNRLLAAGLPVCRPGIAPVEERVCEIDDLYNVNLAADLLDSGGPRSLAETVVRNDVHFGEQGRIFILTGPNRGGKTVFTRAVGLAQVMFQAGLFVPGRRARISPVEGILSHFPSEEQPSLDAGRLGEEAGRIGDVFRRITRHSLVLLNESLSTTSPGEGIYLARDVIRAIRMIGARAIYATHLHELGHVEMINQDTKGDSLAASLVAGSETVAPQAEGEPSVRRTYEIRPGPPQGLSYARDIARKYGIELHQILATLKERKVL
jgi:DNA mismatch repair protein MutS